MNSVAYIFLGSREDIPQALAGAGAEAVAFRATPFPELLHLRIPARGAAVGHWEDTFHDPFPDFMVVNDEDLSDTFAWLSSFLNALAPVTQWCRVWSKSQFQDVLHAKPRPSLARLSLWVGAIVAECSVQGNSNVNLRDITGTAALTSATFSAARALAVWGERAALPDLARRHDDLSVRLREGSRPISATQMLPLWFVLAGKDWGPRQIPDGRAFHVFQGVLTQVEMGLSGSENIANATEFLADELGLPELIACSKGPQTQRVEALDNLATRLASGPTSQVLDAILGYGASLIDPGAAVLPELLRRHSKSMPTAPLWAGAFAAAWAPVRVLSDFQGLGRIVAREILKASDVFSKPEADIAFDELTRWVGTSLRGRVPVRGMVARSLNVELLAGVTAPIPLGRPELAKPEGGGASGQYGYRQASLGLEPDNPRARSSTPRTPTSIGELGDLVNQLGRRLIDLEGVVNQALKPKRGTTRAQPKKPKS